MSGGHGASAAPGVDQGVLPSDQDLDEKYPNRPHNHSQTFVFHELFTSLFNPLNENIKKPSDPKIAGRKRGPHGQTSLPPHEVRRSIIERFISRWRKEVGNDIFPAFRLILPEKDRDRAMYGLKEKAIGRLLIKVMKINKDSADGRNLLNWKVPGHSSATRRAGDFAGICFEVISKRPMRTTYGNLIITEVNDLLDNLSVAQKDETQTHIFEEFYSRMNSEEMMWLIRIILRQMKVGATEKTFFGIWHPDAESLFNVSSSLRRVCWDLYDPSMRLEGEDRGVNLMQCFQPQLAQFQMHSFQKIVDKMRPTEDDRVFWIEEKLDGERMQLHMASDEETPGGKKFGFWSRKAKDYTYLYGNGFFDGNSAVTQHLRDAFHSGVQDIILDGEMITWDMEQDAMVPFGTLKTAALAEQRNPYSNSGQRPLYRVFDILYLNGRDLTNYTLRDRRKALEASVQSTHRRIEVHTYTEATQAKEIEAVLRKVVAESSEGLIVKNPRAQYRLSERHDDWMKVKPEYMTEYGESLDCVIIGGYYGSGHRGGNLSSFLCGLRADEDEIRKGANPAKCDSFFKVGGGFTTQDYAAIRHQTDGKWNEWDPKKPPTDYVVLGGGNAQYERPDVWIKANESIVISVKAASVHGTEQFATNCTLRFPRFKNIRSDRDWSSALSKQGFLAIKESLDSEQKEKEFQVDDARKKRVKTRHKKQITVIGEEIPIFASIDIQKTSIFEGLSFYIVTDSLKPLKKSKAELEELAKANGGKIFQTHFGGENNLCIADRRAVKVVSLEKSGKTDIIRPSWVIHCIEQSKVDSNRPALLLPVEPLHVYFKCQDSRLDIEENIDKFGDSYARDSNIHELKQIFDGMTNEYAHDFDWHDFRDELMEHGGLADLPGWLMEGLAIYFHKVDTKQLQDLPNEKTVQMLHQRLDQASIFVRFAGARVLDSLENEEITHVIIGTDREWMKAVREKISRRKKMPYLVTVEWIEQSWFEKTLLDEERFAPH